MRRLLVHFARYGAYHRARLRTAVEALAPHGWEVFGLEIASTDSTYAWAEVAPPTEKDIGEPLIITAFPGLVHEEITAAEYRRVLHPLLDGLAPDAMAIAGWGSRDAASCLSWCRRHEVRRIVMSETRHADGRRVWWKEMLKHYVIARFDAALVGGKSHRDYLVKLGLPADKIRLGYNVVDNGYFAAEAERWREKTQDGKTQDAREDADGGGLAAEEMPRVGGGLTRGETPRETAWRETRQPQRASHDPRSAIREPRSSRSFSRPIGLSSERIWHGWWMPMRGMWRVFGYQLMVIREEKRGRLARVAMRSRRGAAWMGRKHPICISRRWRQVGRPSGPALPGPGIWCCSVTGSYGKS